MTATAVGLLELYLVFDISLVVYLKLVECNVEM